MDFSVLRRWWPVLAVAALLAVAAVAAAHSALGATRIPPAAENVPFIPEYPETQPSPSFPVEPREAARETAARIPGWVTTAAVVLLGLTALLALGYALWTVLRGALRRTRRRGLPATRPRPSAEGTARDVVAALDAGLIELDDRSSDPRTVVIACWVRLEEAAATAGVSRRAGDTPTDLVSRLLRGDTDSGVPAIVSADVLAEFAHVYRAARYATSTVDERMRDQARAALRRIRAELTVFADEVPT
ncbi:DUF4129 domain-containing protein [Micromonospora echinospora]|uniref:DUF4129 domain-containing protein n=1 Tax=Micromonospora echinospora TaxID=1877 RepID=UPI0011A2E03F